MFHPASGGAIVLVGMDDVLILEESLRRLLHDGVIRLLRRIKSISGLTAGDKLANPPFIVAAGIAVS